MIAQKQPKVVGKAKPKKPKTTPTHPPYNEMVAEAIKSLKERGGSSRQRVAKYILQQYSSAGEMKEINLRVAMCFRRMLKSGSLVNTKGHGASGSVKLSPSVASTSKKVKKSPKKPQKSESKPKAKVSKPKSPKPKTLTKKTSVKKTKVSKPKTSKSNVKTPEKAKAPSKPRTKPKPKA